MGNPTNIAIAGYVLFSFLDFALFFLIKKLPQNKPGFIIDQTVLTDNSSGVSTGQILWTDIEDISVIEIHRQKLIMLQVVNPIYYIDKQTSVFKRKMMEMNYKMYGTPLSITSNGLNFLLMTCYQC